MRGPKALEPQKKALAQEKTGKEVSDKENQENKLKRKRTNNENKENIFSNDVFENVKSKKFKMEGLEQIDSLQVKEPWLIGEKSESKTQILYRPVYESNQMEVYSGGDKLHLTEEELSKQIDFEKSQSLKVRKGVPLFRPDGPSFKDVNQGEHLGDCYLLANLSALARNKPQAVKDMVKDVGDGTFGVRFYVEEKNGIKEKWIRVSGKTVIDQKKRNIQALYNRGLWPLIVEKAYGILQEDLGDPLPFENGIKEGIRENLHPKEQESKKKYQERKPILRKNVNYHDPIFDLTGNRGVMKAFKGAKIEEIFDYLSDLEIGKKNIAYFATFSKLDKGTPIKQQHAYELVGVSKDSDGQQWIELRNPQGKSGAKYNDADALVSDNEAQFKMKIEDVSKYFKHVNHGHIDFELK